MTTDQAEQVIREACAAYVGTLQAHQRIQEAINVVFPPRGELLSVPPLKDKDDAVQ